MRAFPLSMATLEQVYAYALYAMEKRDLGVAIFGVLFGLVCIAPALLIDIVLLPARYRRSGDRPMRHDWGAKARKEKHRDKAFP